MTAPLTPTPAPLTGVVLEEETELTLVDLCRACAAQTDVMLALVHEGVLVPHSPTPLGEVHTLWRFSGVVLHRAKVAVRLQNDLGVNLAGVALALALMDELAVLRQLPQEDPN
jgi:chaperone modulatory protein CbpM